MPIFHVLRISAGTGADTNLQICPCHLTQDNFIPDRHVVSFERIIWHISHATSFALVISKRTLLVCLPNWRMTLKNCVRRTAVHFLISTAASRERSLLHPWPQIQMWGENKCAIMLISMFLVTSCRVPCDGLASHPGGVVILLVAWCYRNLS